MKILKTNWWIW